MADVQATDGDLETWTASVNLADSTQATNDASALSTAVTNAANGDVTAVQTLDCAWVQQSSNDAAATTTYDDSVVSAAQTEADTASDQQKPCKTPAINL